MKPIVAVSSSRQKIALNHSLGQDITYTNNSVINILSEIGCIGIIIPNGISDEDCDKIISISDGLVLTGGQDISSKLYGQKNNINYRKDVSGIGVAYSRPNSLKPDEQRDSIEKSLYDSAKKNKIPVLGICRGMQLINVAEGGTLKQELESDALDHGLGSDGWINYHEIKVVKNSKLYSIVKKESVFTSSIHHQCIDKLGDHLIASAYSTDGIVEAIEINSQDCFIVGIQGHIEQSIKNSSENIKIWNAFSSSMKARLTK